MSKLIINWMVLSYPFEIALFPLYRVSNLLFTNVVVLKYKIFYNAHYGQHVLFNWGVANRDKRG